MIKFDRSAMNTDSDNGEPILKKIKSNNDVETSVERQESLELADNDGEEETPSNNDDDDHLFSFPPDDDVADMIEGVKYHGSFPTITDRYFTPYYKLNVKTLANDICIYVHSNRICMLSLAPSHAVLRSDKQIVKVDFKVSNKLDRVLNKVSGKSKHGAQPLQANSNICIVTCSNGETYTIKCCVIGKLVEVNEALLQNPELLLEPPHKGGYLAIILPNIKLLDQMKESLLTQEQYDLEMSRSNKNDSEMEIIDKEPRLNEDHVASSVAS